MLRIRGDLFKGLLYNHPTIKPILKTKKIKKYRKLNFLFLQNYTSNVQKLQPAQASGDLIHQGGEETQQLSVSGVLSQACSATEASSQEQGTKIKELTVGNIKLNNNAALPQALQLIT